ncbi:hypothetical protein AB6A40_002131 [Gnathostoma spinigerum]|uniref:Uncharacterized protein n=1 Tax=Gnathostoma spinigerum TaxID=75299 RepID=A0ABD6EFH3_9BILA
MGRRRAAPTQSAKRPTKRKIESNTELIEKAAKSEETHNDDNGSEKPVKKRRSLRNKNYGDSNDRDNKENIVSTRSPKNDSGMSAGCSGGVNGKEQRRTCKKNKIPCSQRVKKFTKKGKDLSCTSNEERKKKEEEVKLQNDADSSSESEDEWEELEEVCHLNEILGSDNNSITVTVEDESEKDASAESKWAKCLRLEVNKHLREKQINCHKVHLLCYLAHLRSLVQSLVYAEALPSMCLSLIPDGYVSSAQYKFDMSLAERFLSWFSSAFVVSNKCRLYSNEASTRERVERLEELISSKEYETDRDQASILFLCLLSLGQSVRICLSVHPVPLKLSINSLYDFGGTNMNEIESKIVECARVLAKVEEEGSECRAKKAARRGLGHIINSIKHSDVKQKCKTKPPLSKRPKEKEGRISSRKESSIIKKDCDPKQAKQIRNYWVEYWDLSDERWICLDPLTKAVDDPTVFEANVEGTMDYVLAIDNEFGIRDITGRYSSKFMTQEMKKSRIDDRWWNATLSLQMFRPKKMTRYRMETVDIHNLLFSKPMPTLISEYKNHPLYVLKKDLLKFEAIYPEDQEPLGQIRGQDIYPRSSVHTLQGSLNWLKVARSVKEGEKPYKVVKARPNIRVPEEEREPRTLDLYGYWQTKKYDPPKVVDGKIPRNEYGNIYMYKPCMVPKGCVHVRLDGLASVARDLNIEFVPAVVGWDFHKSGNHPLLEGGVCLKKDEEKLRKTWWKIHQEKLIKAAKRRRARAIKNWRRLARGVIRLRKLRERFPMMDTRKIESDEKLEGHVEEGREGTPAPDDSATAWPAIRFDLNVPEKED